MKKRKYVVIVLVLMLVIGFATVTSTLVINGILNIGENSDDFNIIFTSAKLDGRKRNDFISEDKKHIEFISNELKSIDDEMDLVYEVTNTSRNFDADVHIECESESNEYIMFQYTPSQMIVESSETKSGILKASMLKAVTEETDISITCTLVAEAKERESLGEEYIEPFSKSGVMMSYKYNGSIWDYGSNITKVIFENKLKPHETSDELTFDISSNQDKSVMGYLIPNEDTSKYTLYIQGDTGVKANSNSSNLFSGFTNLLEIENLNYLDTSNVTNMIRMFYNCSSLTSLDVSNFDTSNLTDLRSMFYGCSSLTSLDLSNFDTSKVTDMSSIFYECGSLIMLDLSNFNTSNAIDMRDMFNRCNSLTILNVSNFDTSKVTDMRWMFFGCKSLTNLDVSSFDTINVKFMSSMFNGCSSLKILDVSNFDTNNVTNMDGMFYGCRNLISLDISSFNTINVTRNDNMFALMPNMAIIKVKDKITQDWILALSSNYRPEDWTTENVIIKEA